MTTGKAGEIERMTVTRVLEAPREIVWRAWTDPETVKTWWGPDGFTTPVCEMDVRVGGRFLLCMRTPDGQDFCNAGEYHEVVPHERIVLSMYFADAAGNRVEPEHYGIEHESIEDGTGAARDVVLFEDAGGGHTKLTFIGNETMHSARESGQLEGMEQILAKFAAAVDRMMHAA